MSRKPARAKAKSKEVMTDKNAGAPQLPLGQAPLVEGSVEIGIKGLLTSNRRL
jgi:hypothetical protein